LKDLRYIVKRWSKWRLKALADIYLLCDIAILCLISVNLDNGSISILHDSTCYLYIENQGEICQVGPPVNNDKAFKYSAF
jgi:hypothetical protein